MGLREHQRMKTSITISFLSFFSFMPIRIGSYIYSVYGAWIWKANCSIYIHLYIFIQFNRMLFRNSLPGLMHKQEEEYGIDDYLRKGFSGP